MCEAGPCEDLLVDLRGLGNTDFDHFERIPEEYASLEDVPKLSTDPDNSNEDQDIIID